MCITRGMSLTKWDTHVQPWCFKIKLFLKIKNQRFIYLLVTRRLLLCLSIINIYHIVIYDRILSTIVYNRSLFVPKRMWTWCVVSYISMVWIACESIKRKIVRIIPDFFKAIPHRFLLYIQILCANNLYLTKKKTIYKMRRWQFTEAF